MLEVQDNDSYQQLIADGFQFLSSIAQCYGAERSIEVWDKMGEALGPEIKGQVFLAMLTGQYSNHRVTIQRGTCTQAVQAIKAIRLGTGLGLKEAKDAYDYSGQRSVTLDCSEASDFDRKHMINELRHIGMRVQ